MSQFIILPVGIQQFGVMVSGFSGHVNPASSMQTDSIRGLLPPQLVVNEIMPTDAIFANILDAEDDRLFISLIYKADGSEEDFNKFYDSFPGDSCGIIDQNHRSIEKMILIPMMGDVADGIIQTCVKFPSLHALSPSSRSLVLVILLRPIDENIFGGSSTQTDRCDEVINPRDSISPQRTVSSDLSFDLRLESDEDPCSEVLNPTSILLPMPIAIVLVEPLTAEQLDLVTSPTLMARSLNLTADSPISVSSDDSDKRNPKKKHRRSNIVRDERAECPICHQVFTRRFDLDRHVERHRNPLPKFHCDQCEKAYSRQSTLNDHVRKHH